MRNPIIIFDINEQLLIKDSLKWLPKEVEIHYDFFYIYECMLASLLNYTYNNFFKIRLKYIYTFLILEFNVYQIYFLLMQLTLCIYYM